MSQECTHINPLQRDGTSQRQRMLAALDPSFIQVDEREIQDWLLYARKYAELIRYYNVHNVPDGDWVLFIEKDISTLVAMVAETNVGEYRIRFEAWVAQAETVIESRDAAVSAEAFAGMLGVLHEMANKLSYWYVNSVEGLGLHTQLKTLIASRLEDSFAQLIRWLEGAIECQIPLAEAGLADLDIIRLQRTWPNGDRPVSLVPFYKGIPDREKEINRELIYLERLFKRFYEAIANIVKRAPQFLEETFTDYPQHQPHIALFLAFLNLMEIARDHMNTLTQRHLDFYFKEVLQLSNGPEDPDEVHIILKLANNFDQHLLETNTDFDAGQDEGGEDLVYATDEEIVVNRIEIDEESGLKTLFLHKAEDEDDPNAPIINIHAAQDADALSPEGAENKEPYAQWEALGNEHMPYGEVGFALSSPMFLLGEGERTATITFRLNQFQDTLNRYSRSRIKSELKNNVKVYLSGEEGWFLVEDREVDIQTAGLPNITPADDLDQLGDLKWVLKLSPEDPPIIPYSEEIHQRGFDTIFPTAQFILDNKGLQTLGNLDLTLAGGIAEYGDENFYLSGEMVFAEGTHTVFQAQADVIGVGPSSTDPLWEKTDLDIDGIPLYNSGNTYEIGDIVKDEDGNIFIANACIVDGPPPTPFPDIPSPSTKPCKKNRKGLLPLMPDPKPQGPWGDIPTVWELASPDLADYQADIDYDEGVMVIYQGTIYQAKKPVDAITPNQSDSWTQVAAYQGGLSYSNGEMVLYEAGNTYSYYTAQANSVQDIPPGADDEPIWKEVLVSDYGTTQEYDETDLVKSGTNIYEAMAGMENIAPGFSAAVWNSIPDYGNGDTYTANDEVIYDVGGDKVFRLSQGELTGIPPSTVGPFWREIPSYEVSETYTQEALVTSGGIVVQVVNELGISLKGLAPGPGNGWGVVLEHDVDTDYEKGTVVFISNSPPDFYVALVDIPGDPANSLPDAAPSSWKKLANPNVFQSHVLYVNSEDSGNLVVDVVDHGGNFYQVAPLRESGTVNLLSVEIKGVVPDRTSPLWMLLSPAPLGYNSGVDYAAGTVVEWKSAFYVAEVALKGIDPELSDSPWVEVDAVSSIGTYDPNQWYGPKAGDEKYAKDGGDVYKINISENIRVKGFGPTADVSTLWKLRKNTGDWDATKGDYQVLDIVSHEDKYYEAVSPSVNIDPSSGQTHWRGIPLADIPEFEITQAYPYQSKPSLYVRYVGTAYELTNIQGVTINDTAPSGNSDCWKIISSLDEYSSIVEYEPDPVQYVTFQGRIFLTSFKVVGTPPGFNIPVWGSVEIEDIDEYDPSQYYLQGDFVEVMVDGEACYFQANGGIQGIAPTLEDSMEYWEEVPYYSYTSGYFYNAGACIVLAGRLYRVLGPDPTDQKPGIAASTDWEELTGIGAFQTGHAYTEADIVWQDGVFFKNIQSTSEVVPGSTARAWQERITLVEYDIISTYSAGEYVMFQGEYYRPLTEVGGQDPLTAPELWEKVGVIKPYDEERAYFIGQHVSLDGKVYRAIQNLPPHHSQLVQGNWDAYWVEVLGSYPYNYFRKSELEKIDLDVVVKGMQNVLLENDDGTIEPGKPFNPFGALPKIGSKFYVGSHEVFQKSLTEVTLHMEWADVPNDGSGNLDFNGHYENYDDDLPPPPAAVSPFSSNQDFTALFMMLDKGTWVHPVPNNPIQNPDQELFPVPNALTNPVDNTFSRAYVLSIDPLNFSETPTWNPLNNCGQGCIVGF